MLGLSRAYGVARCAAVPRVRPAGVGLVSANARLNVAAVAAGAGAAAVGSALTALTGTSSWALRLASVLLLAGAVLSLRLPERVDEPAVPAMASAARFRLFAGRPAVTGPLAAALALRALAGLLTILLAFLLRAEGASRLLVVAVIGAAAFGQLVGTMLAARLPETSSRWLAVSVLAAPLVACLGAALSGAGPWVVAAAGTTGVAASLSKFSLDAALQEHVPSRSIGTAFSRAETGLQLAWVLGGAVALVLPTRTGLGFGLAALLPALGAVLARQLARRRWA